MILPKCYGEGSYKLVKSPSPAIDGVGLVYQMSVFDQVWEITVVDFLFVASATTGLLIENLVA